MLFLIGGVLFRMMFRIVLVKELSDLMKICGRYEGLKVDGYGGFREKFERRKRFVCENEEEERKILGYRV
jgi:Txe/YoeB family toxin of Txe-Axe toxin-antitoxin module